MLGLWGAAPHKVVRRTTLCGAAPPYSLDIRFGGSGTAYSKAAHIPVRRACATPLSLKVHPFCLQYAELPPPSLEDRGNFLIIQLGKFLIYRAEKSALLFPRQRLRVKNAQVWH